MKNLCDDTKAGLPLKIFTFLYTRDKLVYLFVILWGYIELMFKTHENRKF